MTIEAIVWVIANSLSVVFISYALREARRDYKATQTADVPELMFLFAKQMFRTQAFFLIEVTILLLIGIFGSLLPQPPPPSIEALFRWGFISFALIITFDSYKTFIYWRKAKRL